MALHASRPVGRLAPVSDLGKAHAIRLPGGAPCRMRHAGVAPARILLEWLVCAPDGRQGELLAAAAALARGRHAPRPPWRLGPG